MLNTVIVTLLIFHLGTCLQDAVANVENKLSEESDQVLKDQAPNVQSDPNPPISNSIEDVIIKAASSQAMGKKGAPAVGLSPQQIDALADKILHIHGVEQVETPENYAKVQRLRNVVSNVENKLENKLKEVAEQANEDNLQKSSDNENIGVTEDENVNVNDISESSPPNKDEDNQVRIEQKAVVDQVQDEQKFIKQNTENEAVVENKEVEINGIKEIEEKQESIQLIEVTSEGDKLVDKAVTNDEDNQVIVEQKAVVDQVQDEQNYIKQNTENEAVVENEEVKINGIKEAEEKQESIQPIEVISEVDKLVDKAVTNDEQDSEILESNGDAGTSQDQELNSDNIEIQVELDKAEVTGTVNDTVTNSDEKLKESVEREPTLDENNNQIENGDRNDDVTEDDISDLQGTEKVTEDNTGYSDTTPILPLGEVELDPEIKTSKDFVNDVDQVDINNLDTISPTPSLKGDNLQEDIVQTRETTSPEEEEEEEEEDGEEVDETDLEICNAEASDCDRGGKNHLYLAENNEPKDEQLEAETEKGFLNKILKFIF